MANAHPGAVTKAVRDQARLRLRAMDLEIAALDLVAAADAIRDGDVAATSVQRVYARVRLALDSAASDLVEAA